ncbi:MAG: hypothetical protein GYA21_11340 [Myxococcales bacterium]|nr:hypothetical protein [Myxococcales bacterium]
MIERAGRGGRGVVLAFLSLVLAGSPTALARYPRVARDAQGTWVPTDSMLVLVTGDFFTFFTTRDGLGADRVRRVAPDEREVWAATARGLSRMDRNSRRWETLFAPDPLPSDNVLCVAVDELFVWVGTDAGAARFDKQSRTWARLDDARGPGLQAVYDILSLGRTVVFGLEDEALLLDRQTGRYSRFGRPEGLRVGAIDEILKLGDNLWFLGREGIARLDLRTREINSFGSHEGLPSPAVNAFAQVQGEIWIATEAGLVTYSPSSDAISPFLYQEGMPPGTVTGIEPALPYVWVSTSQGLGVFNTLTRTWEGRRQEDGLADPDIQGLALAGSSLVLLQEAGFQGYDTQRDEWRTYRTDDIWAGRAGEARAASGVRLNLELTLDGEGMFRGPAGGSLTRTGQIFPDLRLGMGTALPEGRSVDASLSLNTSWVWAEKKSLDLGVREYDGELRVRGNADDALREILLSARLPLRRPEDQHELADDLWLEGAGVRGALGGGRDAAPVELEAQLGLSRGERTREFFRGSIETSYTLSHPYVIAGSEAVKVDGMLLERDVDYIITHTTGQLSFLNPDLVNALSLIEITYTYEQTPREGLVGRSLLQMLPLDNELGSFKRAGTPVYVTDEAGLEKQIDGAAPKYVDRGWQEAVFADYTQGSTSVSVVIHDMGSPEQAREMYEYERPVSHEVLWQEPESEALLDQGLPTAYAVKMRLDQYFVELTVDEKSKSSEILIELFAENIRTKGSLSGTLRDVLRPFVGRMRIGLRPSEHAGVGFGWIGEQDLEDRDLLQNRMLEPGARQVGLLDAWTRHTLGEGDFGGELKTFLQAGRSLSRSRLAGTRSGQALGGDVIYSAPALNLRLDGEVHSRDFAVPAERNTVLGTLENDLRADATFSPWRFLPLRLLYEREQSALDPAFSPEGPGSGVNENLSARIGFQQDRWPTVWLLGSRSLLEANGHRDRKLRLAGSFSYDLARGLLQSWNMKKLLLLAYYDRSDSVIERQGRFGRERWLTLGSVPGTADNLRLELKAAPTRTEDGYVRFERKTFTPGEMTAPAPGLPGGPGYQEGWELIGGAVSRVVPGVVPTFNAKLSSFQGQDSQGARTWQTSSLLSGQLELYPGSWWDPLGSTRLAVSYGFTEGEQSAGVGEDEWAKAGDLHRHQIEGQASYGKYDDLLRLESRNRFWRVQSGEGLPETERYFESQNRIAFRPIYTSPIVLRFDVAELSKLQDSLWGRTRTLTPALEWERRWSPDLVTRLRLSVPVRALEEVIEPVSGNHLNGTDWSLVPWQEVRWRFTGSGQGQTLRLTVRLYQQFLRGNGIDTEKAVELFNSLWLDWERTGVFILRLGAQHTYHKCLALRDGSCRSTHAVQPSLTAIARF